MTTRALMVATALFALDFGGIAWAVGDLHFGPTAAIPLVVGAIALLFALIYLYVPPPLDEALMVLLILTILVALLVPALQVSRSRATRPAGPGGVGRPTRR